MTFCHTKWITVKPQDAKDECLLKHFDGKKTPNRIANRAKMLKALGSKMPYNISAGTVHRFQVRFYPMRGPCLHILRYTKGV
jgi:hypothetical protein